MTKDQNEAGRDQHAEAIERAEIADMARSILGLPTNRTLSIAKNRAVGKTQVTIDEPLPRYAQLAIFIRAAIFGWLHPNVEHMIERNRQLDLWRAVEGLA